MVYDIERYSATSGRVIGEDGEIYNIVDLLKNVGGGGSSMEFLFGSGAPGESVGQPGDVYMDTDNGDIYKNENATWNKKGNLQGPRGPQGERGPKGEPGEDGVDGFPTEEQWNDLVARVEALENA